VCVLWWAQVAVFAAAFSPKPIPRLITVPLPHHEISIQRDGIELTRFHFDPADKRPYLFPVIGPGGQMLTRMGHPHDPFTHSHHDSLWVAHRDVNGVNFWEDPGSAQIRTVKVEELVDGDDAASVTVLNAWTSTNGTALFEERRMTAITLASNEWMLVVDMRLRAEKRAAVLGKTSFGPIAVRMAKSIGVNDGGGMIRNSDGGVNEAGVHWKKARWVDYSGAVARDVVEGITLMDHPANPNHPTVFHVRNDGWMGAALTFDAPLTIGTNRPLQLRYGFYVHRGLPAPAAIEAAWEGFARRPVEPLASDKVKSR